MYKCNRCGLCCELELCSKGRRKYKKIKGNCLYFIKHDDNTTSCQLILEGKMPVHCVSLGEGCAIRKIILKCMKLKWSIENQYEI